MAASPSPYFQRMIDALVLVAPLCIAARYEDGFKHCVEASVCGAAALRRRRIDARPVPCAVVTLGEGEALAFTIGLSPRQLYERVDSASAERPPFETWRTDVARAVPDEEDPIHEVIEARFAGKKALIDLTIGQLRQTGHPDAMKIPLSLVGTGDGWPSFRAPGWTISYEASPHAPAVIARANAKVNKYSNPAFVAEIHDMMELALRFDLDRDRLQAELMRQQPETFATCIARIGALGKASESSGRASTHAGHRP